MQFAAARKINRRLGLGPYPSRSGTPPTLVQRAAIISVTRQGAISRPQDAHALTQNFGLYENWNEAQPRDFSARITRASRSHGLTMKARRKLVYRRLGVLAIALAVPAMATPSLQQSAVESPVEQQMIQPMMPAPAPFVAEAPAPEAALETTFETQAGPAARPFFGALGYADQSRAQQCLALAVYYEAASESVAGQRAVAQVVMNRVRHPSYPDSVCGVVFQGSERTTGCQFSFTCDGSMNRQPQASAMARARMVARAALGGYVYAPVGMATHYHRTDIYPYWASSLQTVGTIGLHRFYRWSGAAGRPAAFTASYAGGEAIPQRRYINAPIVPDLRQDQQLPIYRSSLPAAPTAIETALPAPTVSSGIMPQSGAVLEQHARSGQWLVDPR